MELSPSIIWLIVGSILIAFEVTILPGVGLLFAGLSAICIGVALITGWIESPNKTFEERDTLNTNIVQSINEASSVWGIQCLRYEIKDITPPDNVR